MTSRTTATQTLHRWIHASSVLVVLLALLMPIASEPAGAQDAAPVDLPSRRGDRDIRVYDTAGILTPDEEESLESDLRRASRLGIEMLIYTRMSSDPAETQQLYADALRSEWGVTSGPDADDGIVYLLNVSPDNPDENDIYISRGENALPIRQLDDERLREIVETEIRPAVDEGRFSYAFYYGVRRVLNYAEYSPPNPPSLSGTQEQVGMIARVLAAIAGQVAIIGYVVAPVFTHRRLSLLLPRTSLAWYALIVGGLGIVTGLSGIVGRHAFASLMGLALVVWAGGIVPALSRWLAPKDQREIDAVGINESLATPARESLHA